MTAKPTVLRPISLPMVTALVLAASGVDRSANAQFTNVIQKVIASDGDVADQFGWAVDASGDVAIVGAKADEENGSLSGSVYVFRRIDGQWVEEQKLLASDGGTFDEFGQGVGVSGDVIVVGSTHSENSEFSGFAYVYRWNGAQWVEEQKLAASDGASNDQFGRTSVDVSGDVIVVGAHADQDSGFASGSAYVYRWNGAQWIEEQKLVPSDGDATDVFGWSVDVSGDVIVVGAYQDENDGRIRSGSAYAFRWNGAQWVEEQKLFAADAAAEGDFNDEFGFSVGVNGDVIVVGAVGDSETGRGGSAYVYRWDGAQWVEEQKLIASTGSEIQQYGVDVAVINDVIGVAAPGHNFSAGTVFVYHWNGSQWVEVTQLLASDGATGDTLGGTMFAHGRAVAITGDMILAGAKGADGNGGSSGAVYVFGPQISADSDADGLTDDDEIAIGTDPFDPDSDDDGLLDGEEVLVYATDPLDPDSDGDGLLDGEEVLVAGTDPNDPDTDGDGVPDDTDPFPLEFNLSPVAVCTLEEIAVEAEGDFGALITQLDGSQSFDPDGDALSFHWDASGVVFDDPDSPTPTGIFPVGITMATLTVSDANGGFDTCDVLVVVQDATPPEIMCTSDVAMLWPPNHTMRTVRVIITTIDAIANPADIVVTSATVSSNEPDDDLGDGTSTGDVNGEDGYTSAVDVTPLLFFDPTVGECGAWVADIQLRAERMGDGGDGRCYTIDVTAIDTSDNPGHASCCIVVPHDMGKK